MFFYSAMKFPMVIIGLVNGLVLNMCPSITWTKKHFTFIALYGNLVLIMQNNSILGIMIFFSLLLFTSQIYLLNLFTP